MLPSAIYGLFSASRRDNAIVYTSIPPKTFPVDGWMLTRLMNVYNGLEPLGTMESFAAGVLGFVVLPLVCIHVNSLL